MVRTIIKLLLFIALAACKDGDFEENIITDPALLPPGAIAIIDGIPVCENGDHACFDGSFGMNLTKKQCESLQGWELGDPQVFYISSQPGRHIDAFTVLTPEGVFLRRYRRDLGRYEDIEKNGTYGSGWIVEKGCRCQISFDKGLIRRVYVDSPFANATQQQIDACATKEL